MNTKYLEIISTVSLVGSFSKAALFHETGQSNISYAVKKIETYFDKKIFIRSANGCTLTPDGKKILVTINNFISVTNSIRLNKFQCKVKVISCLSPDELCFENILSRTWKKNNNIIVESTYSDDPNDAMKQFSIGMFDIYIGPTYTELTEYTIHKTWTESYYIVSSDEKILMKNHSEIAKKLYISYDHPGHTYLDRELQLQSPNIQKIGNMRNLKHLINSILNIDAYTILPETIADNSIIKNNLYKKSINILKKNKIISKPNSLLSSGAKNLLKHLIEC